MIESNVNPEDELIKFIRNNIEENGVENKTDKSSQPKKIIKAKTFNVSEDKRRFSAKKRKQSDDNKMNKVVKKYKVKYNKTNFNKEIFKKSDEAKSKEIQELFSSEHLQANNIKSLLKESKINDTIVALISLFIIVLCFIQLHLLIQSNYIQTDKILTIRTCIIILSIPNSNNK